VGTSLAQTMQERRDQFHTLRLGESLDPFNPAVASFLDQARALFLQQTGDPVAAQQLAWQALENLRQQQASALAYFDVFWLLAAPSDPHVVREETDLMSPSHTPCEIARALPRLPSL